MSFSLPSGLALQSSAQKLIHAFAIVTMMLIGGLSPAVAESGDEVCFPLYRNTRAIPGDQFCPIIASSASIGMGTYYCTSDADRIYRYCGSVPKDINSCPRSVGNPIDSGTGNKYLRARLETH